MVQINGSRSHRAALKAELERALAARGAEDWEALFNAHGVPAGQVLTVPQVLCEAQVTGRQFIETVEGETTTGAAMRVARPGFLIDGGYPRPSPPPVLGQDTERWLLALGYDTETIERLRAPTAATQPQSPRSIPKE